MLRRGVRSAGPRLPLGAPVSAQAEGEKKRDRSWVLHSFLDGANWPRIRWGANGNPRYLCEKCGTWTCQRCGHKRRYANRAYTGVHRCGREGCGSMVGKWSVVYHDVLKWANHYGHVPTADWTGRDNSPEGQAEKAKRAERLRKGSGWTWGS